QVFSLSELPLEEYAFSLGLAAIPRVPGLDKALKKMSSSTGNERQREEARAKKNVNRSLQRLKEQIKADKLRKRL
ncbi:unnamed protein product, partial [Laminaria digitata]